MLDFTKFFFFIIEIVYAFSFLVCSNSELYIYTAIYNDWWLILNIKTIFTPGINPLSYYILFFLHIFSLDFLK